VGGVAGSVEGVEGKVLCRDGLGARLKRLGSLQNRCHHKVYDLDCIQQ
jgi:hypothetical protein